MCVHELITVKLYQKKGYRYNHMQGKITKMWLANEEGIFS